MNEKQYSVIFLIEKIAENQLRRDLSMFEWARIFQESISLFEEELKEFYEKGKLDGINNTGTFEEHYKNETNDENQ